MLYKKPQIQFYPYIVQRDDYKCVRCLGCVEQCSYDATFYDEELDVLWNKHEACVGCKRCEAMCPTDALKIVPNPSRPYEHASWKWDLVMDAYLQANTGSIIITGIGNDKPYRVYFDHLLIDACQVTNPSIDPLREPMELRTFLGRKGEKIEFAETESGKIALKTRLAPQLELETPIMFSAMSYGSINLNFQESMARAAVKLGTYWNTGEGGLHKKLYPYAGRGIVQVASGRFGVSRDYLKAAAAVEIKIDQGAKPGIGGHLPGEKVNADIAETRMIPPGSDAISPAPHHDIYSIEDLRQLIYAIKEATRYEKPVFVKIAAVHNVAAIASGIARAGADIIVVDGFRGGTGATPKSIRDHVGIPVEVAIAAVDRRLRQEGIRNEVSIVATGGIRSSADVIKIIALGADAVYIATVAMLAIGCTLCQTCNTGRCAWGITTNDPRLARRQNPDIASEQLYNLVTGWSHEMKEMLGAMGINSIESLKGNRLRLRSIGLTEKESEILGVLPVGE
ncbi:MAG: glutamate synthase-related protein [Nitrospirota bacterium]